MIQKKNNNENNSIIIEYIFLQFLTNLSTFQMINYTSSSYHVFVFLPESVQLVQLHIFYHKNYLKTLLILIIKINITMYIGLMNGIIRHVTKVFISEQ